MAYHNIEEMKAVCESANSMAAAAKELGMNYDTLKKYAKEHGFFKTNQSGKGTSKVYTGVVYETADILEGKHPQYTTAKLKNRLVKEGYLEYKCVWCGITDTYNDKPIVLHLDHINGINNDHRLENLRLLCPNCHSQTDTWCGRGKVRSK